jgi:hypothetical protein
MTAQIIPADIIAAAQADRGGWHIPACADIAQCGVESAFCRFEPPGSNNCFGIQRLPGLPYVSAASHEERGGKLVPVTEDFAKFASLADAFYQHDKLIATNPVYAPAMAFVGNYVKYIELMGPRYATAPNYVKTLLAMIDEDGLARYNVAAGIPIAPTATAPVSRTVAHLTSLTSIMAVQDALNRLGAATPILTLDGRYGVLTRAAIRKFQSWSGLAVDGDVGPATIVALEKAINRPVWTATTWKPQTAPAAAPAPGPTPASAPPVAARVAAVQAQVAVLTDAPAHLSILEKLEAALKMMAG